MAQMINNCYAQIFIIVIILINACDMIDNGCCSDNEVRRIETETNRTESLIKNVSPLFDK
jgi:hypothetical protein